jgi:hypothetical protein
VERHSLTRSRRAAQRRRLIPDPTDTEEQAARFYHRDLVTPDLDARLLWAERLIVEYALARRLFRRRRRIVFVEADGTPVDDTCWLEQRAPACGPPRHGSSMARETPIGPAPWDRPTSAGFARPAAAKASPNGHRPAPAASVTPHEKAKAALPLTAIGDLLAEPDEIVDWLVEARIPTASTCLLAGKPKTGKTTAARDLALAVARGETWLGRACAPGAVWYLALEGRRQDHKAHFRRMGATAADRLWVYVGRASKTIVADVRLRAQQERPTLIIVDTLQRFIKASSMDDYAEITTLFDVVLEIARTSGAALLLLHHAGKADRASLDAVLGSTAITGSVDQIFVIARTGKVRTIQSIQRVGEDLDERILDLAPVTGRVHLGQTRELHERDLMAQALYDALDRANTGLTQQEWFGLVEGRRGRRSWPPCVNYWFPKSRGSR